MRYLAILLATISSGWAQLILKSSDFRHHV